MDGKGSVLGRQRHVEGLKFRGMRGMTTDQVVRRAPEDGGDRLDHRFTVIAPAPFNFVELASVHCDRARQLRLCQATVSAPFADVVLRRRLVVGHFFLGSRCMIKALPSPQLSRVPTPAERLCGLRKDRPSDASLGRSVARGRGGMSPRIPQRAREQGN